MAPMVNNVMHVNEYLFYILKLFFTLRLMIILLAFITPYRIVYTHNAINKLYNGPGFSSKTNVFFKHVK